MAEQSHTYRDWMAVRADLRRTKTGDRAYDVYRKSTGEKVGHVVQTGERGRDDYPWEAETTLPGWIGAQASMDDALGQIATKILEAENG